MPRHPLQPVIQDEQGVDRFKANVIVARLLAFASARGYGPNEIP